MKHVKKKNFFDVSYNKKKGKKERMKESMKRKKNHKDVKRKGSRLKQEEKIGVIQSAQEKVNMKLSVATDKTFFLRIVGGLAVLAFLTVIVVVILINEDTKNVVINLLNPVSGDYRNTSSPDSTTTRESFASIIVIGVGVTFGITGIFALMFLLTGASSQVKILLGSTLLSTSLGVILITGVAISLVAIITNEQSVPLRMAGAFLILQALLLYGFRSLIRRVVFEDEFIEQLKDIRSVLESDKLTLNQKKVIFDMINGLDESNVKQVLDALNKGETVDQKVKEIQNFLQKNEDMKKLREKQNLEVQNQGVIAKKIKSFLPNNPLTTISNLGQKGIQEIGKQSQDWMETSVEASNPVTSFFTGKPNYGVAPARKFINQWKQVIRFNEYEKSKGKWGLKFFSAQKIDPLTEGRNVIPIPSLPRHPLQLPQPYSSRPD